MVLYYQGTINVEKTCIPLREKYGKIFRDVFVCLASFEYVFYISIQSFRACERNGK